ncbi:MAG: hypothetical protein ACJ734_10115, partial [Gaiellaceae bacterium]
VHVAEARAVVDELVELVETGQEIGPATVDAVLKAIDQAENVQDVFGDVVRNVENLFCQASFSLTN